MTEQEGVNGGSRVHGVLGHMGENALAYLFDRLVNARARARTERVRERARARASERASGRAGKSGREGGRERERETHTSRFDLLGG